MSLSSFSLYCSLLPSAASMGNMCLSSRASAGTAPKASNANVTVSLVRIDRLLYESQKYESQKNPGRPFGYPGESLLGVDPPVFQQARPNRAHRALVRGGELLQRAAGIERGEELAVFFL